MVRGFIAFVLVAFAAQSAFASRLERVYAQNSNQAFYKCNDELEKGETLELVQDMGDGSYMCHIND